MAQKRLSQAEWEIMQGVWEVGESVPVRSIVDGLYPNGEKAYTTVQTTMNIMTEKEILTRRKMGSINLYSANLSRDDVTLTETKSLASKMFQGSFGTLAAYLIDSGEIPEEELDKIRQMIEAQGGKPTEGGR